MKRNLSIVAAALAMLLGARSAPADEPLALPAAPVVVLPGGAAAAAPATGPIAETLGLPGSAACPGGACGGACGDACSSCRSWHATFDASAVYMQRLRNTRTPLFVDPTGATILNNRDFHFDWEPGADMKLILDGPDCWGAEVRYLWLNNYDARLGVAGVAALQTTPPTNFGAFTGVFDYQSRLQSGEVSLRRSFNDNRFTVLGGFRYLDLHEVMAGAVNLGAVAPVGTTATWRTRNNLYGFQLGVDGRLWSSCRFHVDGFLRAGAYCNDASSSFVTPRGPRFANARSTDIAFVGETGISATYQVTKNVAIRGGYQFLWLSGVALAGEQVSTTANFDPVGAIPSSINRGDTFYHGASLGLEVRW